MMHRRTWITRAIGAALGGVALLSASGAAAMRYVEFNILLGGRRVLRASMGDSGHEDSDTVRRYLKRLPLRSLDGYAVKPDPGQPLRATLRGKLRIEASGVEEVTLSSLRLVRSSAAAKWRIDPRDIDHSSRRRRPLKR